MPPPRDFHNILEGPGDYDVTADVHSDTYPAIDPIKLNLSGRAVLVVGASRGIGKAIALSYARAGASKIAVSATAAPDAVAKDVASAAAAAGRALPQVLPLSIQLTDRANVEAAAATVEREFGSLDIVVHSAGIFTRSRIVEDDPDDWWNGWTVNVRGTYLVARSFVPLLLKGDLKTLVNVASVGAFLAGPGLSAYQATKMALVQLTNFINAEHGDKGIIAFPVHPGNVDTDMTAGLRNGPLAPIFCDSPELTGDTLAWLTAERRPWIAGRYINVTWDAPQLAARADEIVEKNLLKVTLRF